MEGEGGWDSVAYISSALPPTLEDASKLAREEPKPLDLSPSGSPRPLKMSLAVLARDILQVAVAEKRLPAVKLKLTVL